METNEFDIPVVLMTFLRTEGALRIIERIKQVKPRKVYLLCDGPRNDKEAKIIADLRKKVVASIDWGAEIKTRFLDTNGGVYENIANGAKWVFSQEEKAIFLEDDNLPDVSFFFFCQQMLDRYEDDERVFWICGTNYLRRYTPEDHSDYVFTRHLLPCGWASWSGKFLNYYDQDFALVKDRSVRRKVRKTYIKKSLYRQQLRSIKKELYRKKHQMPYVSWDFQTVFSLRGNDLYGIAPKYNLINNIGMDDCSIHIISAKKDKNVHKFCDIETEQMPDVIKHPDKLHIDKTFEKATAKIILQPLYVRLLAPLTTLLKKMLRLYPNYSFMSLFRKKNTKKH